MQRAKARALLGQGKLCKGPGAEKSSMYLRINHHHCHPYLDLSTLCSVTFPLFNSTGSIAGPPNSVALFLPFLARAPSSTPHTAGHIVILKILWGTIAPLAHPFLFVQPSQSGSRVED